MNWRSVCALVLPCCVFACATATNGAAPGEAAGADSGGDGPTGVSGAPQGGAHGGAAPSTAGRAGSVSAGSGSGGALGIAGHASGGGAGLAGSSGAATGGHSGTSPGGSAGLGGSVAASGASGASGAGSGPCADPKDVSGGKTNNLGTKGAVCLRTTESFNTIGCSNWGGRTVKVNGQLATCNLKGAFAPPIEGYNYFEISSGDVDFAALVWYTS